MTNFKVPYKAKKGKHWKKHDIIFDDSYAVRKGTENLEPKLTPEINKIMTKINRLTTKMATPRTVEDFLEEAGAKLIERGREYDRSGCERSAARAAEAFNVITGHELRTAEVWLLLQILKDVRQFTRGYHQDSAVDCIAYAALKAEALASQT